ncbi:MAG: restriction endonuclease subunit S [bacterium]|nr:restriction endonuclease subunit S [bacterium]MDY3830575.1 restriction endonuclease subunit S [Erysipelotrichaceae bacterium]
MEQNTKLIPIEKLFYKVKCKKLPYKAADLKEIGKSKDTIPVLSAGIDNQGLAYFAPRANATVIKNAISVSANGANSGAMFYHPFEFSVLQDSYAIKFIDRELNENEYLYMLTCMQKVIKSNYNWTNKAGWERIKGIKIELPVDGDGNIDFEYINSFMASLKDEETKSINFRMNSASIKPEKLSADEKTIISDYFNDCHRMKTIKIGDYFRIIYNPSLDKRNFEFSDDAEYPYFTRTVFNNGIAGYVKYYDEEHMILGNAIAVGLLQMGFFYIDRNFYAGQFTKTIYPKFDDFDEYIGLFFASLFNKQSEKFKSVLVRDFDTCFLNSEVDVPVNDNNEIDFDFIRTLVKILEKEILENVSI